jgi:biotin synthase-related radical SAM superfamily protein
MRAIGFSANLPEMIRVSLGSAVVMGLEDAKLSASPTTAYLMTHRQEKCTANCRFCPQARTSNADPNMLSRVSWPAYQTQEALRGIVGAVNSCRTKRVCIQALNYRQVFADLYALVRAIRHSVKVPVSVSSQPLNCENICSLAEAGVERVGIPLDAASEEIFERVKGAGAGGPYTWEKQWQLLGEATEVFGKGMISTHLIVGLGESGKEMVETIQRCVDMTVLPALFAFTPIMGTALEERVKPSVEQYRRMQVARYLIVHRIARFEEMMFDGKGSVTGFGISRRTLSQIVRTGEPFVTSGCPDCNRPFYNEKPSGPLYNFPEQPTSVQLSTIEKQLDLQ